MSAVIRTYLRVHRTYLMAWLIPLLGLMAAVVPIFTSSDDSDVAGLEALINSMRGSGPIIALYGPIPEPFSVGWLLVWEMGMWIPLLGGVMISVLAVNLTRGNEEAGRTEMMLVSGMRRRDPLRAALAVIMVIALFMGIFTAASMSAQINAVPDTPVAGCWWFGLGITLAITAFGTLAVICGQLASNARAARLAGLLTVAVAFVIRAVADSGGPGWLRWFSPLGWRDQIRPLWGVRPLAALIMTVVCLGLLAIAWHLEKERDLAAPARLRAARAGRDAQELPARTAGITERERAGRGLTVPGLTWRIERSTVLAWFVGICALVFFWSSALGTIEESLARAGDEMQASWEMYAPSAQSQAAVFLELITLFSTLLTCCAVIQISLRVISSEDQGLVAHILSRGHRAREILASNAMASGVLLLLLGTVGALCTGAIIRGGDLPQMAGHGRWVMWAAIPPAVFCGGLVMAAAGLAPRAVKAIWVVVAASGVISILGPMLKFPSAVLKISILEYPMYQADGSYHLGGGAVMIALGLAGLVLGMTAIGRRDQLAG